jgi:hypothetical protein
MSKLENCGFCGFLPTLKKFGIVVCENPDCGALGPSYDKEGAQWNALMRRAAAVGTPNAPAPKRKIVQIAVDALGNLTGLDNDGGLWEVKFDETVFWRPFIGPDLPGDAS